ncbi:MAG: hypothetical protein OXG13_13805 [Gemmatimonadaceae bacterium]|nr:hypothetical protein [Gemmatimonadaceae bacterium]
MRILLVTLLALLSSAYAHMGDEIYPIYQLLDEDLDQIDLTDGSVDDWLDVLGEPSLTAADFYYPYSSYDPTNCDNRFWLGWHRRSSTLWVAMERFDDIYHNNYAGEILEAGLPKMFRPTMFRWDSYFSFMVDGDHSGGRYLFGRNSCDGCTVEETKLLNNRQAQHYLAIAETTDGQHVGYDGAGEWVTREPYAAAGGGVLGATPVLSVTELKVTPFDDLVYDDEAASVASDLYPGKIIGFTIRTKDNDATEFPDGMGAGEFQWLSDRVSTLSLADLFVDGLLLGAAEDPSVYDGDDDSAVQPSSWARIKAALE